MSGINICREAAKLLGQDVLQLTFAEIEFENAFDGIWACASLLHVPKNEINCVINKLKKALKPTGIFYASFKYGTGEREVNGRVFNDYDETSLRALLENTGLTVHDIFITEDVREDRAGEKWVNVIAREEIQCQD